MVDRESRQTGAAPLFWPRPPCQGGRSDDVKKHIVMLTPALIFLLFLCAVMTGASYFYNTRLFYVELVLLLAAVGVVIFCMKRAQKYTYELLGHMGEILSDTQRGVLTSFPLPVLVTDIEGQIVWSNDLFRDRVLSGGDLYDGNIAQVANIDHTVDCPEKGVNIVRAGREYTVFFSNAAKHEEQLKIFYFVDDTVVKHFAHEYHITRPCIAIILIDNYEELQQNAKENERSQIFAEIETTVEKYFSANKAFICKTDRDRFVAIVEKQYLDQMVKQRFDVLDSVRGISASENMTATLSIGIGVGAKDLTESEQMARQALDMCLGRGGDQAALRSKEGYEFFGGVSKGVEKRTKVKARIVASALQELIESHENVIVMGHQFADMDSLGSAVGIYRVAKSMGKDACICIDPTRHLVASLMALLKENGYTGAFRSPEEVLPTITPDTLLVVVDTHLKHFVQSYDVYAACKTVVVIDHHRKTIGHIDNAVIFYHEPYASSASEMVAEMLPYFGEKRRINRVEAEALLAGIMLDTKNFIMRAGVRTFEAAAYLRRMGADTVEARRLFSTSMDEYRSRTRIISSAQVYRNCAIAGVKEPLEHVKLVAPQAADELLNISGVDASFSIYEYDGGVSISARSMGAVNVQVIMEQLGGGGHQTMAATQLKDITFDEAREKLLEAIDRYYTTNVKKSK